jgi:putative two-component system response regulator
MATATLVSREPIAIPSQWTRGRPFEGGAGLVYPPARSRTHNAYRVLAVMLPTDVSRMRELLGTVWRSTVVGSTLEAKEMLRQHLNMVVLDGHLPFTKLQELCHIVRRVHDGRLAVLLLIDPAMPIEQLDALGIDMVLPHTSDQAELHWWMMTLIRTSMFTNMPVQAAVEQLIASIAAKDTVADGHLQRVADYAVAVGRKLELSPPMLRALRYGALLHDVGKVGVADVVLGKPACLTADEYHHIQQHPIIGEKIIRHLNIDPVVAQIVRHHHERWDGTGYPDQLRSLDIPLCARIVAVVDAFDAMTSKRAYSTPRGHSEAITELYRGSGTRWDATIVAMFTNWLEMIYRPVSCART